MTEPTGLPPQDPPPVTPPAPEPAPVVPAPPAAAPEPAPIVPAPPAAAPAPPPVAAAPPPVAPAPPVQAAPQPAPAAPAYNYVPATGRPGPAPGVYFASHPARLIAWIIDGIILSIVVTVLYLAIGLVGGLVATGSNDLGVLILVVGWVVAGIVGLVWYPYWWSKSGQSPGKKIMHLKVVRAENGELLSFGGGFLRLIGYWISAFVFYIGFLWILVDGKRQGWADKVASTYVIEVP